jgi:hypothetical protein
MGTKTPILAEHILTYIDWYGLIHSTLELK